MLSLVPLALLLSSHLASARAYSSYANAFVNPHVVLNTSAWKTNPATLPAQHNIIQTANFLTADGPWTVTSKSILPPSKDIHDYLSWPPYAWPDCSKAKNTTELTPEQIWVTCPYVTRDGQFNPDQHTVNDTGHFFVLGDAVLYNALAWVITSNETYASNAATIIDKWFVNKDTAMNPNLNFAQLLRGPGKQSGQHTGLLDLKGMAKVASGVLMLRQGKAASWTSDVDTGLRAWVNAYLPWVTTNSIAVGERKSANNHGSFYFNQLAALYLIVDDLKSAKGAVDEYFNGIWQTQVNSTGEQPEEAVRTHPYHYRAYNLGAMITNARIGSYLGDSSYWTRNTRLGGNIRSAVNLALSKSSSTSHEEGAEDEMGDVIAAVWTEVNGDPSKDQDIKGWADFVAKYFDVSEPFNLWDYHTIEGWTSTSTSSSSAAGSSPSSKSTPSSKNGSSALTASNPWGHFVTLTFVSFGLFVLL